MSAERIVYDRWNSPPESLELSSAEAHVWRVRIPTQTDHLDQWRGILSDDERKRAEQFKFDKDRNAYCTTRAVLRELLARYTHQPPESLDFEVNAYGKPELTNACNSQDVQFNVSHSGAYALLAFGKTHPLGVDLERIRDNVQDITDLLLSSMEKELFNGLTDTQRLASLFHVWTSKEAIIKALGKGFSIPLHDVTVDVDPKHPPTLVGLSAQVGQAADWRLHGLRVDQDYSATLAARAAIGQLRCWDWR